MDQQKHKTAKRIAGITAVAAAALGIFLFSESRSDKFIYRTQISGLDITGCTLADAKEKVLANYAEDTIRLMEDGQITLEGTLGEFGYTLDEKKLETVLSDLFVREKTDLATLFLCELGVSKATAEIPFSVDQAVFSQKVRVENLAIARRDAQNAEVVFDETGDKCVITPEVYGNRISDEALSSYVKEQLDALVAGHSEERSQVNSPAIGLATVEIMFPADGITAPEILQDAPSLIATCEALNAYAGSRVIYEFGEEKLDVNFGQIMEMLDVEVDDEKLAELVAGNAADLPDQSSGETTARAATAGTSSGASAETSLASAVSVSLNEEAVEAFVSDLAATYNTRYRDREFETSVGSTVTIPAKYCDYGYTIDQEEELAQLKHDLLGGSVVERDPVYYLKNSYGNPYFYKRNGKDDLAGTYIEVNLTRQHMWYYLDGELFLESDVVSGDISKGHGTQYGVFPLAYKESPSVLTGGQGDGEYETKVNYWMPFYEGQGLHDASWRYRFGGSIYRSNGSHGCVNLPTSVAENLYNHVEPGVAIVIYYE